MIGDIFMPRTYRALPIAIEFRLGAASTLALVEPREGLSQPLPSRIAWSVAPGDPDHRDFYLFTQDLIYTKA